MKKKIMLCGLSAALVFSLGSIGINEINTLEAEVDPTIESLHNLLESYYDGGMYKKHTIINVNEESLQELRQYFHAGGTTLERTTYYCKDALWMSRGVEGANTKYSYYGTAYDGQIAVGVTNATTVNPLSVPENASIVLKGTNKNSMEEYYLTLDDFIKGSHVSDHTNGKLLDLDAGWSLENGVYTSTDADVLDGMRLFAAPLWVGKTETNANYFSYTKATIEEVSGQLVMKLYVSGTNDGAIKGSDGNESTEELFAQATIFKNSENLQANYGTNFNGFILKPLGGWENGYGNFSTGMIDITCDGNNEFAKLNASSIITKALNIDVLKQGTYTLKMDVKLAKNSSGTLSFGIYNGLTWLPSDNKTVIDITGATDNQWTTVTSTYTFDVDKSGPFANLDISYFSNDLSGNDYILIDNIEVIKDGVNVDVNNNNDFEFFNLLDGKLSTTGWKQDNRGDVIYIADKFENSLIAENGNAYVKAYTSNSSHTNITFAGSKEIANEGIYKMSIKVKLGEQATNVDNIGFRFSSNANLGIQDTVFTNLNTLSKDEWVTLEAIFVNKQTQAVDFVNIDFWIFTHNDVILQENNYVLIDDVEIYKVY